MGVPEDEQLTQLEQSRVSQAHRQRMTSCYREFCIWVNQFHAEWSDWSAGGFDSLLTRYVQDCKDLGVAFWRAKYAALGLQWKHPRLRFNLQRAWNSLQSWHLERPVGGRTPMSELVLHAW